MLETLITTNRKMPSYPIRHFDNGPTHPALQLVNDFAFGPKQTTLFKVCTTVHKIRLIMVQVNRMDGLVYPTAEAVFTNKLSLTALLTVTTLTRLAATDCCRRPPPRLLTTKSSHPQLNKKLTELIHSNFIQDPVSGRVDLTSRRSYHRHLDRRI